MKILVTGVGGPAGRNICEMLMKRNHQIVGTDIRAVYPAGIAFHLVPPAESPAFCETLGRIAQLEHVDMVIPTVSEELPVLAGKRLNWTIPLILASKDAVTVANDKFQTYCFLRRHGLSTPRTVLPSQITQPEDIQALLGWPCLSKPRVGRGGRSVTVYAENNWPEIRQLDDTFLLQEFISGTEYCPNLFRSESGPTVTVVLEKLGLKQGLVGNAADVRQVDIPIVADLAEKAVNALNLTGPADIDIRCRKDGTPVILEINARFGANIQKAPEVLDALLQQYQIIGSGLPEERIAANQPCSTAVSGHVFSKIPGIATQP